MHRRLFALWAIALSLLLPPHSLFAETVQGRIMEISRLANTIQINIPNQDPLVVRFSEQTRFIEAEGIGDLGGNDLIEVEFTPGQPATQIRKIVFGLPPGVEISIQELLAILTGDAPYALYDTRPRGPFLSGTIPSSRNAFTREPQETFLAQLPDAKDQLLIFYCGGPTCPYTGEAVEMAQEAGYTQVKGFQGGIPVWRRSQLPLHAAPVWLADRLNTAHVVIDTRNPILAAQQHLPGAVSMPAANFEALTNLFIREEREAMLPGVADRRAPIILYHDTHSDTDLLIAFRELASWGYRNIAILHDGLQGWISANLPVEQNNLAFSIRYIRQLAPGAIAPEAFMALDLTRDDLLVLDVRSDEEASTGTIRGSLHIPLEKVEDRLAEIDKNKEIIAICATGIRAEMVYRLLQGQGYNVQFLNEQIEISQDGDFRVL